MNSKPMNSELIFVKVLKTVIQELMNSTLGSKMFSSTPGSHTMK